MVEVTIRGFQAVEDVALVVEGFTALVGRSNIGKSAIVRAIKCALTNASGTDFVRHGARCSRRIRGTKKCRCQCSVWIRTSGLDLLWEKGDEINQYTINGQIYNKPDRGTPSFLQADFSPVKVGDEKLLLQVADQFDPIFLLNKSGTVVADVLSDVAMLDDINAATSLAEKDRREAVSTSKVREKDLIATRDRLEFYATLDEPLARVSGVEKQYRSLQDSTKEVQNLSDLCLRLQALASVVRGLKPVESVTIPEVDSVVAEMEGLTRLVGFEVAFSNRLVLVQSLDGVDLIEVPAVNLLEDSGRSLIDLENWVTVAQDFKARVVKWKAVEAVVEPSFDLAQAAQDLTSLWRMATQHDGLATEVTDLESSLEDIEKSETQVMSEWEVLGVCPTCSQSLRVGGHAAHA